MTRLDHIRAKDWHVGNRGAQWVVTTPDGEHVFDTFKDMLLWQVEDQPDQKRLMSEAFGRMMGE